MDGWDAKAGAALAHAICAIYTALRA